MKSKLYTRTGDKGTTSLVDGSRRGKDNLRVEAYGDIDELSSMMGFLVAGKDCPSEIKDEIHHIQHIMFSIGGYLATPVKEGEENELSDLKGEEEILEGWIDSIDERVPVLKNFILPGGTEESSRCHLARTICRRAERNIIKLSRQEYVDPKVIAYVNRLSDYLFIAARYLNFLSGIEDIAWQPGKELK